MRTGANAVIRIAGELDVATAPQLSAEIADVRLLDLANAFGLDG